MTSTVDADRIYRQLVAELTPRPQSRTEKLAGHRLVETLKARQTEAVPRKRGGGWRTGGKLIKITPQSILLQATDGHSEEIMLESVRCDESSYWRTPCPLPTMARGLFIHTCDGEPFLPEDDPGIASGGRAAARKRRAYEIVIRGYDKFFSIDETPSTKMEALKRDMMGPYEVSTKENGCIVFIAALSPTRLVVTSKNSLGDEDAPSHPQVGRQWLLRHLAEANRTQQEFCQFLHDQQVTAVFELCDDAFEEHIVAYPPSRRGLYLHGINRNTVELQTWPMEQVERVARAFGFHMVKYHVYHTLDDVLSYCRSIESEQSIYDNGEQIEGFVVRGHHRPSAEDESEGGGERKPFFFKYKFDEPYLMFREWRELTKGLLAGRNVSPRYAWTVDYLEWCRKARKQHPELFEGYQHNHGIIAVRNAFLEWWMAQGREFVGAKMLSSGERKARWKANKDEADAAEDVLVKRPLVTPVEKLVIVPVATIGCGKTTLSRALSTLLQAEHIQNDNIREGRNKRAAFNSQLVNALHRSSIVIADRNNHLPDHRKSIAETVRQVYPQAALVMVYFQQMDIKAQFELATRRVEQRGEHHQMLTPNKTPDYRRIIHRFIRDFVPPDPLAHREDIAYDLTITLDPADTIEHNLKHVLADILPLLDRPSPSPQTILDAANAALHYRLPAETAPAPASPAPARQPLPAYIGVDIEPGAITGRLAACLEQANQTAFYRQLVANNRLPAAFHVTLCHIGNRKPNTPEGDLWHAHLARAKDVAAASSPPPAITLSVTHIVWDDDVMALRVELGAPDWAQSTNPYPHITVGTRTDDIKARQANTLLERAFAAPASSTKHEPAKEASANAAPRQANVSYASALARSMPTAAPISVTMAAAQPERPNVIKLDTPWTITGVFKAYYK